MKVPQFYVRSKVHMTNLDSAINRLLVNESLIDVTLACDGHRFQCHRLVLAAASPLFEELLMEHPKQHPIVIIPIGVKWNILKSLIDFMYRGQTCINQAELKTLIESAELLQVIGLYDPQTQFREYFGEDDDDENISVEQKSEEVYCTNEENEEETEEQELNQSNDTNSDHDQNHSQSQNQDQDQNQEIMDTSDENMNEDENNIDKSTERIVDFIEIEDSQDTLQQVPADECTASNDEANRTNEEAHETNCIPISNQNPRETNADDVTEVEGTKILESGVLQNVPKLTITEKTTTTTKTNETMPTIRVKPTIKLINLFKLNRPGQMDGNQSPSNVPWTYIHIPAPVGSNIQSPSTQVPLNNVAVPLSQWSVNSLPQLMPAAVIAKSVQESTKKTTVERAGIVPSFLKFNSSSMAISVKNLDRAKTREKLNVRNMALESESPEHQPVNQQESEGEEASADVRNKELDSGESLRIKQEPEVKTESMDFDSDGGNKSDDADAEANADVEDNADIEDNADVEDIADVEANIDADTEAENIICQPNVSYIYDGQEYETYGNTQHNSQKSKKKPINKKLKTKVQLRSLASIAAAENCKSKTSSHRPTASELAKSHHHIHQRLKDPPTLVPLSVMNAGLGPKHLYYHHNKNNKKKMAINEKTDNGFSIFEESTTIADLPDSHTQNSVILRNPRFNQPRHYSNESLYAALMAVKYGDSIYKASRLHQVPRKTLRNWMKRWDIKSQYPMPKQLKDAAKKKKLNQNQSD